MRLSYHPAAEKELLAATEFYEERSSGLGSRFLREFDAAVADIQAFPERWPIVEGNLRCRTLKRFPFAIYFQLQDQDVIILVIKHHSQHPNYWRNRLDN